ncbi:MAG: PDZ domain-containing protein, partial [Anaerolineales bacterium]|nr:PDZ domain-containing protein [Anaerolineales bacterium]MDW8447148.1 PDZ domain-containing protein [Anaerolineales bacterium]
SHGRVLFAPEQPGRAGSASRARGAAETTARIQDLPVVAGGPAAKAGLRGSSNTVIVRGREVEIGGDVVTAINGEPVRSFDDLLIYVSLKGKPGDTVELTVVRENREIPIRVKLETRPATLEP